MLRFGFTRFFRRKRRSIERIGADPARFQATVLRRLLRRARNTEWGARHGFAELARKSDVVGAFQRRVPIRGYDGFEESIARMRAGEADVLWPGRVRSFAHSSGTTSFPKKIPVSREMFRAMTGFGAALCAFHADEVGNVDSFAGEAVGLTGGVGNDPDHPGTRLGEISGLLAEYGSRAPLQRVVRARRAVPQRLKKITDLYEQIDAIVDHALVRDVRMLAFPPSWGLVLLERLIARHNEMHDARVETAGEIWPNLGMVVCNSMPLAPYREALRERIGRSRVCLLETYAASEAFLAFQASSRAVDLRLHLNEGTFTEFVRLEERNSDRPRRETLVDIEPGVPYVPVLSTCSGLWAYDLGDIVEFTCLGPPMLRVIGRTAEYLDSYGENLSGDEVRRALGQACERTRVRAVEFHLAPVPASAGRPHAHQWLVEFVGEPGNLDVFARELDDCLRVISPAYEVSRRDRGMGTPEVVRVPPNAFHRFLEEWSGAGRFQAKVPCMGDDREFAEGVLGLSRRSSW